MFEEFVFAYSNEREHEILNLTLPLYFPVAPSVEDSPTPVPEELDQNPDADLAHEEKKLNDLKALFEKVGVLLPHFSPLKMLPDASPGKRIRDGAFRAGF